MILWIIVLILSPQVLTRSFYILFVANSILIMIKMHTIHPHCISIMSVGATLAFIVLLLVWQSISLENTTLVHVILC